MSTIKNLLLPHIAALKPYSTARHEFTGKATVFLDANESPVSPKLAGIVSTENINRYPDPLCTELRKEIASVAEVSPENCMVTNGSDEAIDLLLRAFCAPGKDATLICPPTYGMYQVAAMTNNLRLIEVPLSGDWQLDVKGVARELNQPTCKICFFCSPNNPTGNLLRHEDILQILSLAKSIVVVDEAYIDFAPPASSLLRQLKSFDNLVILQTFSKAWGLTGLRAGKLFAPRELIDVLLKIKAPYNVNSLTQKLVTESLRSPQRVNNLVEEIQRARAGLAKELSSLPFVEEVFPSQANFLLVRFKSSEEVFHYLLQKGIVVRNRSKEYGCHNCLRITIGSAEENDILLQALREI